jgi:hypothetical protein
MSNIAMFNPSNVPAFAKNAVLSASTLALAGGASSGGGMKRVSIKGGVFRLLSNGKEIASIEKEVKAKLEKILTKDQLETLNRPPMGGPGGPGGGFSQRGRGGPGGPPDGPDGEDAPRKNRGGNQAKKKGPPRDDDN